MLNCRDVFLALSQLYSLSNMPLILWDAVQTLYCTRHSTTFYEDIFSLQLKLFKFSHPNCGISHVFVWVTYLHDWTRCQVFAAVFYLGFNISTPFLTIFYLLIFLVRSHCLSWAVSAVASLHGPTVLLSMSNPEQCCSSKVCWHCKCHQ